MSMFDMKSAIRRYGPWAGVRHLRNRGVRFEDAYSAVFDRKPRLA